MSKERYQIGIIVVWFGKLPSYFYAWLKSAEYNKTIDFIIFSDQEVVSDSNNIFIYRTTLQNEVNKFSKKLGRPIYINNSYKFCDCRLFFGILYEDYLKGYDFWGYCDIDLVFGNLRDFLTDEILEKYERIYPYGHLCLYRNNKKMNYIYKLPGSIYSLKEIFENPAKTTVEEAFGVNRICTMNDIKWYKEVDFADFISFLPKRLDMAHSRINNVHQIFIWDKGDAFRVFCSDKKNIKKEKLVYLHWQKKTPKLDITIKEFQNKQKFIIGAEQIITSFNDKITISEMDRINPPVSKRDIKKALMRKIFITLKKFFLADIYVKKIWVRQILFRLLLK
ncbi:hypothetical protein D3Z47_09245 [Lachnospiraceae bacterium]|nr:hypothetical protein [Lachnospiraceae bacterium]